VRAWFVHDFPSEAWLRGEEAYYVKNDDLITPMGMGIAAFSEQAEAEAYIGENGGKLFSLEELRAEVHVRMH
jgi:nitrous oxide reductase accessory protein NosL